MSNLTKRFITWPFLHSLGRMSTRIIVAWALLLGCMIVTFLLFIGWVNAVGHITPDPLMGMRSVQGDSLSPNQLLVLKVQGVIVGDSNSPEAASSADLTVSGYGIKRQLYAAANRDSIKGILLEIDSPGGAIYGAQAIADGVKYYQDKTKHPVYAHIEGIGASGAYWAAASASKVIADYGSETGSIGVIMGPFEYYDKVISQSDGANEVVTQNGIQSVEITAGRSKDLGNPYRRLTPAEQAELQRQVNNNYDQFVTYVSARRDIPVDTIKNQIGAMTYDNKTAQEYKLIDSSGSREDALSQLAKAADLQDGDYRLMALPASGGRDFSLLGAFMNKPAQPKASSTGCAFSHMPLAYSGNITDLCR